VVLPWPMTQFWQLRDVAIRCAPGPPNVAHFLLGRFSSSMSRMTSYISWYSRSRHCNGALALGGQISIAAVSFHCAMRFLAGTKRYREQLSNLL
jgi:hypothetical protein